MIKQLHKHKLDFDLTWEYVQDDLDKTNKLSAELLHLLNFKDGYFFTLLPAGAKLEEIHHFKLGGILPQYPKELNMINGNLSSYSWIPDLNEEVSQLILQEINSKPQLSCIIDKITGTASEACYATYFEANPLFYEKEVYFLFGRRNASIELLQKYLKISTSFWHSLCVLTTADLKDITKTLSFEKVKEICLEAELLMIGAYDGEGYVFWEKNSINGSKGFFE